ncbi:MAG: alpha/beta hydrolase [bacterium]|nr:MAG: alpha/beta hydrolase [bacterium]
MSETFRLRHYASSLLLILFLFPCPAHGRDEVVVLLHGIANVPLSMKFIQYHLEEEGYTVLNLGYSSTEMSIEEAAEGVRTRVSRWIKNNRHEGKTIHFVAHSMGNIVSRKAVGTGFPRLGRMVMIAPPNRGSLTAAQLKDLQLFKWIYGPAGQQLSADNRIFFDRLPVPPCEFGVIAGGKDDGEGYNPLLAGDDDGTVRVEETKLEGMADFILLHNMHTMILFDRDAADQVVHFLRNGRFNHLSVPGGTEMGR